MGKDYYLGLDIGTGSVGWAVTDENYNICKYKKRAMWGIRLFAGANTAADRRLKRGVRRRLSRKKQRIDLLQEIFAEEINKVDPTFFIRLNESRLHMEDKTIKELHPLFIDKEYSDIDYYKEYPTIFHLRKELIHNPEKHDIRLVYLALHSIIKTRGHFLIDGELGTCINFETTFNNCFDKLCEEMELNIDIDKDSKEELREILKDRKIAKSDKSKNLKKFFNICELDKEGESYNRQKYSIEAFCKLIAGSKGDLLNLFGIEKTNELLKSLDIGNGKNETLSISFSDKEEDYLKAKSKIEEIDPEKVYLLDLIKTIYDWNILVDILQDNEFLSDARVEQYESHKENLKKLRKLIKKYLPDEYNKFFNSTNEKDYASYSSYVGHIKKNGKKYDVKKCTSEEDLYKNISKILDRIEPDDEDKDLLEDLKKGSKLENLLPIQRSKNNGSIPRQVHEVELKIISDNASKYLPFLNEKDTDGYENKDKIIKIFEFRIPYYVGPLSARHKEEGSNYWAVRKEEGRIYPWNFKEKVDEEKSNEEFIARMTNKCTYLLGEDVLPKNSLLYSKYMVLNELNNLSVLGKKITVETKKEIFNSLFKERAKVTVDDLLKFFETDIPEIKKEDLGGFDGEFKTSLKSYLDFKKQIFGDDIDKPENQSMVEDIIKWKTIYGDDRRMLENVINKKYPNKIDKEKMSKIHGFKYSGWGNFSYKFLKELQGRNKNREEFFWRRSKHYKCALGD